MRFCFNLLLRGLMVASLGTALAQPSVSPAGPAPMLLWPDGAPGALGTEETDKPTITAYLPAANSAKTAVVIFPGGGYVGLASGKEGSDIARWLNVRGVAGFVVKYRLGPRYHHPIEMQDGQRAIRLVRAHAAEYGIAPDHIGVWGFSAGGHMAATMATQFDLGQPNATDPIDRPSSRPDFAVLAYPVITMEAPVAHAGSVKNLLGDTPEPALIEAMSAEKHVTQRTSPAFLFATYDDKTVPVMNSVLFYAAMVKAGVPAEMHLYQHGPHGVGLAAGFPQLKGWPDVLAHWMAANGWMSAESAALVTTP